MPAPVVPILSTVIAPGAPSLVPPTVLQARAATITTALLLTVFFLLAALISARRAAFVPN